MVADEVAEVGCQELSGEEEWYGMAEMRVDRNRCEAEPMVMRGVAGATCQKIVFGKFEKA